MRYWAWLTTNQKGATKARIESNPDPIMPDIAPFSYLIDLLATIGPSELTWQEISSWCGLTGIQLSVWESNTIKRLSAIYTSCANKYHDSTAVSPYKSVEAPKVKDDDIRSALRSGNFRD